MAQPFRTSRLIWEIRVKSCYGRPADGIVLEAQVTGVETTEIGHFATLSPFWASPGHRSFCFVLCFWIGFKGGDNGDASTCAERYMILYLALERRGSARARIAIVSTLATDPRTRRKHKVFWRHGQATKITKAQNALSPLSPRGMEREPSRFDARMGR